MSLWVGGTITQFHKPQICVEQAQAERAAELIREYENVKRLRGTADDDEEHAQVEAVCEDCGRTASFPASFNGTTQDCPICQAFVDVRELPWDDDVNETAETQ